MRHIKRGNLIEKTLAERKKFLVRAGNPLGKGEMAERKEDYDEEMTGHETNPRSDLGTNQR